MNSASMIPTHTCASLRIAVPVQGRNHVCCIQRRAQATPVRHNPLPRGPAVSAGIFRHLRAVKATGATSSGVSFSGTGSGGDVGGGGRGKGGGSGGFPPCGLPSLRGRASSRQFVLLSQQGRPTSKSYSTLARLPKRGPKRNVYDKIQRR